MCHSNRKEHLFSKLSTDLRTITVHSRSISKIYRNTSLSSLLPTTWLWLDRAEDPISSNPRENENRRNTLSRKMDHVCWRPAFHIRSWLLWTWVNEIHFSVECQLFTVIYLWCKWWATMISAVPIGQLMTDLVSAMLTVAQNNSGREFNYIPNTKEQNNFNHSSCKMIQYLYISIEWITLLDSRQSCRSLCEVITTKGIRNPYPAMDMQGTIVFGTWKGIDTHSHQTNQWSKFVHMFSFCLNL